MSGEPLDDWRTAIAKVGYIQPRLGENIFLLQVTDGGKNRSGMNGAGGWAGAMRRHANRTGGPVRLARVGMGRLHRRRPNYQGQA